MYILITLSIILSVDGYSSNIVTYLFLNILAALVV